MQERPEGCSWMVKRTGRRIVCLNRLLIGLNQVSDIKIPGHRPFIILQNEIDCTLYAFVILVNSYDHMPGIDSINFIVDLDGPCDR